MKRAARLVLLSSVAVLGCGGGRSGKSAQAPTDKDLGDPSGAVVVVWQAKYATPNESGDSVPVDVTLVVDGKPVALGELETDVDETDPTRPAECSVDPFESAAEPGAPPETSFVCNVGSSNNMFTARLDGGQVIVTLMNGQPGDRVTKEVKRIAVQGTSLKVLPAPKTETASP